MHHQISLGPIKPLFALNDKGPITLHFNLLPRVVSNMGMLQQAQAGMALLDQPLANSPGSETLRKQQVLELHAHRVIAPLTSFSFGTHSSPFNQEKFKGLALKEHGSHLCNRLGDSQEILSFFTFTSSLTPYSCSFIPVECTNSCIAFASS